MIKRYTLPEMGKIWEDEFKFSTWLKIEILACEARAKLGEIPEKDVDVITLDLPEPWKALSAADKALKIGGFIVSYSPTTPQVSDFTAAAAKNKNLLYVKTIEIIQREWEFNERVVRPKSQQIGHSGFLTFLRKVA